MAKRRLRILADHCVPGPVCDWLRGLRRVQLLTVAELRMHLRADSEIVGVATKRNLVVLAADRGFNELNYVICTHPGIIEVSTFNSRPETCKRKLSWLLSHARKEISHSVVHVRENNLYIVGRGDRRVTIPYRGKLPRRRRAS